MIGKDNAGPSGSDKTSIVVSINNRIGALHEMLAPFWKYRINLTRIESRPSKRKAWKYFFFLDLLGHATQPKIKKALRALEEKSESLKVLGSYPVTE